VDRYQAQVAEGRLSKWMVGVTAAGRHIEINLDSLALGPFEKDKLIKCALETEGAECYAYATNIRVMDEETHKLNERVLIVCATADDYIGGDWNVVRRTVRSPSSRSGDGRDKIPARRRERGF
jgi:hypothetical protein